MRYPWLRNLASADGPLGDVDRKVMELFLLFVLACLCLGLAWAYEADFFAIFFAAAAAVAGVEAVRRSL